VAALKWNEWQLSSGLGGSFALEYAPNSMLGWRNVAKNWLCVRILINRRARPPIVLPKNSSY
jgi:hypothetical protein